MMMVLKTNSHFTMESLMGHRLLCYTTSLFPPLAGCILSRLCPSSPPLLREECEEETNRWDTCKVARGFWKSSEWGSTDVSFLASFSQILVGRSPDRRAVLEARIVCLVLVSPLLLLCPPVDVNVSGRVWVGDVDGWWQVRGASVSLHCFDCSQWLVLCVTEDVCVTAADSPC